MCNYMDGPEDIMLSEKCQSQKNKYCIIPLYALYKTGKFTKAENTMVTVREWGEVEEKIIVQWV